MRKLLILIRDHPIWGILLSLGTVTLAIVGVLAYCSNNSESESPDVQDTSTQQTPIADNNEQPQVPFQTPTTASTSTPISGIPLPSPEAESNQQDLDESFPTILVDTSDFGSLSITQPVPTSNPYDPSDPDPTVRPCLDTSIKCRTLKLQLLNFEPGDYVVACENDGWNGGARDEWRHIPATIHEDGTVEFERPFCHLNFALLTGQRGVRVIVRGPKEVVDGTVQYPGVVKTEWFNEVEVEVKTMR